MSSLAERLAAARKQTETGAAPPPPPAVRGPTARSRPRLPRRRALVAVVVPAGATPSRRREPAARRRRWPARGNRKNAENERLEQLKQDVHSELLKQLGPQLYDANLDQADLDHRVRAVLAQLMSSQERPISNADRNRLTQEISDDILGYGPIEPFLRDVDVSEVMVNGHDSIYLERDGKLVKANASFSDEAHVRRTIDKIVSRIGRRVDESSPMVDARLPDGSRVNAVIPPLAVDGSSLTIRKFAADPLTSDDLIAFGTLSERSVEFLDACVRGRLNIIVSGSTGAGKTTTLNVLSSFIPEDERIVTIEDAAELQLKQDHVVRLESRPGQHRGSRHGHDPRPGQERPAYAPGPHHRRRGPRRLRARHAPGHEHRSRRLDLYPPLQRPARHPGPHGDDGADGGHGPAGARDPRAGGLRGRPDRPPDPVQGRLAPDHLA